MSMYKIAVPSGIADSNESSGGVCTRLAASDHWCLQTMLQRPGSRRKGDQALCAALCREGSPGNDRTGTMLPQSIGRSRLDTQMQRQRWTVTDHCTQASTAMRR